MALIGISIEKAKALDRRMRRLKIFEKDIHEDFIRASGPGGQNVNKVSTCVVLKHLPTGTQVRSQQERSQALNRYQARCRLMDKIEQKQQAQQQKVVEARERKKRQNRKRPKALKEKILEEKRRQSEKKQSRRKMKTHIAENLQ